MAPKVNRATQAVLDARRMYIERLQSVIKSEASPPYMTQRVDPRTADRQAAMTTPEDLAAMFQQNPAMAEATAKRIDDLRKRAEENPPPFSAPEQYEVTE